MAGALKPPTPKGNVKLEVVAEQPKPQPPESVAPNPKLEQAIEQADAKSAADASKEEGTKKQPRAAKSKTATVLTVVKDIANATDPRPSRKIPTAEEWEPYIQRGLVYCSVLYIWWLTTDDDGNELGDTRKYELDDERAGIIGTPFARLWARTPFNRRYGRDLIENMDSVTAAVALVTYVMDTRPLWRARRELQERKARGGNNKVVSIRRAQTTNARPEPQPLEQPTESSVNGGEPSHAESERPVESPFKSELHWTPGEHHRSD